MHHEVIFKKYTIENLKDVVRIFKSNVPTYFLPQELKDFIGFLEKDFIEEYYVVELNEKIIGCGGIAPNTDGTVCFTWGMIEDQYHKKGFGKLLLEYRLNKCREIYADRTVKLRTTQHTNAFFEKYNFKTVKVEKDFWADGFDLYEMILSIK
jgi:[ribosomal protein S18]-alanine N-acetyltransferase